MRRLWCVLGSISCLVFILACSGGAAATRPTSTPAATATPAPTEAPTAIPEPTATLSPEAQIVEITKRAASPNMREGAWQASQGDFGNGPRITLIMPLNDLGSNEQIVRLNQNRMAGAAKALLETYPEIAEVNVQGTLPLNGSEADAISLVLTRDELIAWSGIPADLTGWQVSQRLSS
jgi:hypothetical protein